MPARCQPRRPRGCPNLGFRGWLLNESEPIAATLPVSRDPRPAAPFESQTKSPACNSNHFNPLRAVKYPLTNSLPHGTLLHDTSPFEQTPPASLAESIASTLPKMEGFNLLLSNSFHTLQKTTRGIPPPSHFGTPQIRSTPPQLALRIHQMLANLRHFYISFATSRHPIRTSPIPP